MKKLLVSCFFCLFIVCLATPATASGLLDEYVFSTEWWPRERQTGSLEFNLFGKNALNFIGYQALKSDALLTVNGFFGTAFEDVDLGSGIFNATFKTGTPDFYIGVGGILGFDDEKIIALPRFNLGGKLGPQLFKVVLDADIYTLILVNGGKLEAGIEVNPLPVLQLYGGVSKLFIHRVVATETLPGHFIQFQAKLETRPLFLRGEVNFFGSSSAPLYIGEAGVNISSFTLLGKIIYPGLYSVGLRFNY
ncbi:MAG: hypothetical protein GX050_03130 [Firmicutes bacterium]|nr:hypothetical protein [Bacillota bacterium]